MATTGMPFAGKSLTEIFQDANFQNLLAGAGARLDPQGIGGALGGATIALNKSFGAQKVAENQGAANEAQQRDMKTELDLLRAQRLNNTPPVGVPVTPPNVPGPTSIKANPDGSVTTTSTPDNGPGSTANQLATPLVSTSPTVSAPPKTNVSPAGEAVLNATNEDTPIVMEGIQVTAPREPLVTPVVASTANIPAAPAAQGTRYVNRGSQTPIDMQNFLPFYSRQRV